MNVEDFDIPVPWGHIAAKSWGDSNDKPVLVTHGRLDNAGAFDRLIPLLPQGFYYICIDLPSHGKSSILPSIFPIYALDFVIVYKFVLDYFKRSKYILLGHSFGASIGNYVAQFYPEYIEKIIGIDSVTTYVPVESMKEYLTKSFGTMFRAHEKQNNRNIKTYTEEEITEKVCNSRWGEPITAEAAKAMVQRMIKAAGDGKYQIVADPRMSYPVYPLHDVDFVRKMLKTYPISCPYLLIMCKKSSAKTLCEPVIEEYKKWKNFHVQWVDAEHDVHITNPRMIAPYITNFLIKSESKL